MAVDVHAISGDSSNHDGVLQAGETEGDGRVHDHAENAHGEAHDHGPERAIV